MDNNNFYKHRLSENITWLRFPLIFLIIMLHCYSVAKLDGDRDVFFKIIYPFSLWLGETGVPGFFFISGYLFFLSKKSYKQKLETRFHTLLIPYLLWNAILLSFYLVAFAAGYPQEINYRNIAEYKLIDYLRLFWDRGSYDDGNFVPLLCPFWYIRNLLIMCLLSPILLYIIRYARGAFILFVAIWWMMTYHNAFIPQTILFFSLGAYFSIHNINPLKVFSENKRWVLSFFCIIAVADFLTHMGYGTPFNLQIHRLALIINIPALFLLADFCVQKGYSNNLLPNSAFIVFAVHYPIVVVLRKFCAAKFAAASDGMHILLYFVCIVIATAASLLFYLVLAKYFPRLKNILSGNR